MFVFFKEERFVLFWNVLVVCDRSVEIWVKFVNVGVWIIAASPMFRVFFYAEERSSI